MSLILKLAVARSGDSPRSAVSYSQTTFKLS